VDLWITSITAAENTHRFRRGGMLFFYIIWSLYYRYNNEESLIMKIEKPRNTLKTQAQPRSAKSQSAKTGIKIRSGLRAGYLMSFTDKY